MVDTGYSIVRAHGKELTGYRYIVKGSWLFEMGAWYPVPTTIHK
jgi:hypothetical protein